VSKYPIFCASLLLLSSLSSGCGSELFGLPALAPDPGAGINSMLAATAQLSRQRVRVSFLNQLPNGERVPLVPEVLDSLSFNGQFSLDRSAFPANQGLEQTFPFIEAGEHVIELFFSTQSEAVRIPLVVPALETPELSVLVILSFDATGSNIRTVQVGYDQNGDGELDRDQNIYRSSNGRSYLIHRPDGRTSEWVFPLNQASQDNVSSNDEAPLPPGSERESVLREQAPQPQSESGSEPAGPPPMDVPQIPVPRPVPLPVPQL